MDYTPWQDLHQTVGLQHKLMDDILSTPATADKETYFSSIKNTAATKFAAKLTQMRIAVSLIWYD